VLGFWRWFRGGAARAAGEPAARWVVLDVESSGLDASQDRLLAIAALGVHRQGRTLALLPSDSFEVVLRQEAGAAVPDRANILLHGIGVGAQREGTERREALGAFAGFVGNSPLVAFHAAFDRAMIERACALEALPVPANLWLDLEPLAAVLMPQVAARSLDEWMAALRIPCAARHEAAADTWSTAELLQQLWPRLVQELGETPDFAAVSRLAAMRRWLPR
jgi:DNA polymerase III subunit epsilon